MIVGSGEQTQVQEQVWLSTDAPAQALMMMSEYTTAEKTLMLLVSKGIA